MRFTLSHLQNVSDVLPPLVPFKLKDLTQPPLKHEYMKIYFKPLPVWVADNQ